MHMIRPGEMYGVKFVYLQVCSVCIQDSCQHRRVMVLSRGLIITRPYGTSPVIRSYPYPPACPAPGIRYVLGLPVGGPPA